jgi:NADH:ubiquinone oxidoreductase subunit 2 (subunit N)
MPPLAGFFGKFYLFSAAMSAGDNHGLLWLVALALFGSLISFYYYLVVLKVIFVDEPSEPQTFLSRHSLLSRRSLAEADDEGDFLQRTSLAVLATAVIFLGVLPGTLIARITASLP